MFQVVGQVLLPILLIAGTGFLLQRLARLDVRTLSKLNVNVLVPAFLFHNFYHTQLRLSESGTASLFTLGVMAVALAGSLFVGWRVGMKRPMLVAFASCVVFYNSGNYGLSVMELLFPGEEKAFVTSLQAVVMTTQNIVNFTVGVFFLSRGTRNLRDSVVKAVSYPIFPAFLLAILLRHFGVVIPHFLDTVTMRLSQALVPMGLITLGVQIGTVRRVERVRTLLTASLLRLAGGPLVGLGLVYGLGLSGMTAQVLLISSAVPTAVNTALLSIEFENESGFASQAVLFSTLFSVLTVSVVIYAAMHWLP